MRYDDLHELFDTRYLSLSIGILGATLAFTVSASQIALTAAGLVLTMAIALWVLGFTLMGGIFGAIAGIMVAFAFTALSEEAEAEVQQPLESNVKNSRPVATQTFKKMPKLENQFTDSLAYGI